MENIKPLKIGKRNGNELLTSAEVGKLWATYVGNTMAKCIMVHFIQHVNDEDIKSILQDSIKMCQDFADGSKKIFESIKHPVPKGFSDDDVNPGAPRLFLDQFYLHYIRYALRAGVGIYSVAVPMVDRKDVKDFFAYCVDETMKLTIKLKELMQAKSIPTKSPIIPIPDGIEFADKNYLNGFFGDVRPLHALEIAHVYDDIGANSVSDALSTAFSQVAKSDKIRQFFRKGKNIMFKSVEGYSEILHQEGLSSLPLLSQLITKSTFSPYSDKLMLFHEIDLFSIKMRDIGNSISVNGRHDLGLVYMKNLMAIMPFVEEGAKILIEHGWMEEIPKALDRKKLSKGDS